jgi:threonine synthase
LTSNIAVFECVSCGRHIHSDGAHYLCPVCGGNLDVVYDYERISGAWRRSQLSSSREWSMWRYRPLLPIEDTSVLPPLAIGWTPIYPCPKLAAEFGVGQLLIKDDGRNPTGSFKDRPSALAAVKAREACASVITTASSGNAGSALAGICASIGMRSVIFVPAAAPAAKVAQLLIYGSRVVLVEGTYDQAYDLCIAAAEKFGWYQRSTGYNPYTREGKKTAAYEICEQLDWQVPAKVMVSVGDGNIISGLWKGFRDFYRLGFIDRLPQLIGVQAAGASAVVDASNGDGKIRPVAAHTLADSINVGLPRDGYAALRAIRESGGRGITVSDDEILAAISNLARATGVFAEPAAAASYAGFVKLSDAGAIRETDTVLLMITGSGLKDIESARRAVSEPLRVPPDLDEFTARYSDDV